MEKILLEASFMLKSYDKILKILALPKRLSLKCEFSIILKVSFQFILLEKVDEDWRYLYAPYLLLGVLCR